MWKTNANPYAPPIKVDRLFKMKDPLDPTRDTHPRPYFVTGSGDQNRAPALGKKLDVNVPKWPSV